MRRTLLILAGLVVCGAGCRVEVVDTIAIADGDETNSADGDDGETNSERGDDGAADEGADGGGDGGAPLPIFDVGGGESQIGSCEFASQFPSHLGCEFYAIDVDQPGLFDQDPYAFVIVNPLDEPVEVELDRHNGQEWAEIESTTIPAQSMRQFEPGDNQAYGTGTFLSAVFRMTSSAPVVAVQFSSGHSTSATMLQPAAAWTETTHVAGWRTHEGLGERSFMGVMARSPGTTVTVDMSFGLALAAPPEEWLTPVPNQLQFTLQPGALTRLDAKATDAEVDHGISGTLVSSGQEHPNAVFSAHTCAAIPDYDGTCGHMQEQLVSRLAGQRFVAPRMVLFSDANNDLAMIHERTMVQVVATQPDTEVAFLYADGQELESVTIDPEDPYAVYQADHELMVVADKPVVVSAYMTNPVLTSLGSPSMVQLAPVEQWTGLHHVWVPEGYETHLLVASASAAGVQVEQVATLDGSPLPANPVAPTTQVHGVFAPELGDREVARVPVEPGVYRVRSGTPASVVVAGWRGGDGFAYLGGWGASFADLGPAG